MKKLVYGEQLKPGGKYYLGPKPEQQKTEQEKIKDRVFIKRLNTRGCSLRSNSRTPGTWIDYALVAAFNRLDVTNKEACNLFVLRALAEEPKRVSCAFRQLVWESGTGVRPYWYAHAGSQSPSSIRWAEFYKVIDLELRKRFVDHLVKAVEQ